MSDDFTGKTLGQYEVVEEIGRGGMATVYKARQSSINRTVAVKILPRNLLHDPDFYERFEREVDVIAHLEHPHILPIYDYGSDEGVPYIVMRFLAGGSLQDKLRKNRMPLDELEKPISQVASALDYAHQHGIIHRDLKPANIMLDESGNAYLTDFGIARVLGSELTGSMLLGTPAYMSPEQASGLPLDARSDVYALGVVLFEMLTGREPYQAETPMALLLKHINEPIPPLGDYRDDVPPSLEFVIQRATAKSPDDRFASAGDLAQGLRAALNDSAYISLDMSDSAVMESESTAVLDSQPPAETSKPRPKPVAQSTAATTPQPTPAPTVDSPATRRLSPVVMGVIALAVLIVGGGALALPAVLPPTVLPTLDYAATFAAETAYTPTAFPDSQSFASDQFSISIPAGWSGPVAQSGDGRTRRVWRDSNDTALVSLSLVADEVGDTQQFRQAAMTYDSRFYENDDHLTLIDEAIAPDGTLRRSFRLHNPDATGDSLPSGQMDVFYLQRAPWLAVVEVYSADSASDTLVPVFQSVLDSVRISG